MSRPAAVRFATVALAALLLYLLVVLVLGSQVAGATLTWPWIAGAFVLGTAGLARGLDRAVRLAPGTLVNGALLAIALLVSLLVGDLAISAYLSLTSPNTNLRTLAKTDRLALVEEWYPRTYYPTAANFVVHKPDFTITGRHYGGFYVPGMLRSTTLRDSVLDLRELTIHIDRRGFRERSPIESCPILTVGDSFTFGWGVTEGANWPDLLEAGLGRCVYNLGVNGASPGQEQLLLEDLFSRGEAPAPRRLLWAIYEGNDLEDSYAPERPLGQDQGLLERAIRGTVLEAGRQVWRNLRTQSLLHRLRTGDLRLTAPATRRAEASRSAVDGVRLATPLFHSPRFGYMLVDAELLRRAAMPESYVLRHDHRRQLDRAFALVRRLAEREEFAVTVVVIPTSARLYAPYFDFTPAPSPVPHFVDYLTRLSRANGFDVVNLLERLEPIARTELLYFRDDDHLNPRGHEVVAGILAEHLRAMDSAQGR